MKILFFNWSFGKRKAVLFDYTFTFIKIAIEVFGLIINGLKSAEKLGILYFEKKTYWQEAQMFQCLGMINKDLEKFASQT